MRLIKAILHMMLFGVVWGLLQGGVVLVLGKLLIPGLFSQFWWMCLSGGVFSIITFISTCGYARFLQGERLLILYPLTMLAACAIGSLAGTRSGSYYELYPVSFYIMLAQILIAFLGAELGWWWRTQVAKRKIGAEDEATCTGSAS